MSKPSTAVPAHVGFIMDGNRRWAKAKGLPSVEGHRRGYANVKQVLQWCLDRGIRFVTVFAFSTENWNRSKHEVSYLMRLMNFAIQEMLKDLQKKNIRLQVIGRMEELPKNLQERLRHAIDVTKKNTKAILNIAVNYGGRAEIVDGVKRLLREGVRDAQVTEERLAKAMYNDVVPDPDLIVRTSGEQRLSGFLLWEAAYAELYFTPKKWPEFSEKDLDNALADYAQRKRNFGS